MIDDSGRPHLWSRNGLTLEIKFPGAVKAVRRLKLRSTILDGEVVAIDQKGIREIPIVPEMAETGRRFLAYHLFDLLWTEGIDVIVEAFWKDEGD